MRSEKIMFTRVLCSDHMRVHNCTLSGIEDLREKREEILKQLREDDAEKAKIQQDLQLLTKRLAQVNDSIARKVRKAGTDKTDNSTVVSWHMAMQSHGMCEFCESPNYAPCHPLSYVFKFLYTFRMRPKWNMTRLSKRQKRLI